MKIIGLTGGIGSGKTTVGKVFESLKIPVYNADNRAKALYFKPKVKEAVIDLFGDEVYIDGELNRAYLAQIVFKDKEKLQQLNAIIHPAVGDDFKEWLAQQDAPYVLKEAAILIEAGTYKSCDEVILVEAPIEIRIERVLKRDEMTRKDVEDRISKQWSDEQKRPFAKYVIHNDGEKSIIHQVLEIHEQILGRIF